jgi:hypothetical protein
MTAFVAASSCNTCSRRAGLVVVSETVQRSQFHEVNRTINRIPVQREKNERHHEVR